MSDFIQPTCSTCGKPFDPATCKSRPFCSRRCQTIDLGRWLDEEVSVPHEGGPEADQEPPDQVREIRFDDEP